MLQIARDIDVGKDSGIVDLYLRDFEFISLQQTPGTVVPPQRQQFIAVMRGKSDRMAAPAITRWSSQGRTG